MRSGVGGSLRVLCPAWSYWHRGGGGAARGARVVRGDPLRRRPVTVHDPGLSGGHKCWDRGEEGCPTTK